VIRAYESDLTTGVRLMIGVLPGRTRPTLAIQQGGDEPVILASFHGEKHAQAAINVLDAFVDDINRVLKHLTENGNDGE
jgi:hypothetical protein